MSYSTEYDAQLSALVAGVASVPQVGRVHDRHRAGTAEQHWTALIDAKPEIRAWEIGPQGHVVNRREQHFRHRYRTWEIVGYVGLVDASTINEHAQGIDTDIDPAASWHVINRLAGEISDVLDLDQTLAGSMIHHDPVVIPAPDVVVIGGGHTVWSVTLTLTGYTIVTP